MSNRSTLIIRQQFISGFSDNKSKALTITRVNYGLLNKLLTLLDAIQK